MSELVQVYTRVDRTFTLLVIYLQAKEDAKLLRSVVLPLEEVGSSKQNKRDREIANVVAYHNDVDSEPIGYCIHPKSKHV